MLEGTLNMQIRSNGYDMKVHVIFNWLQKIQRSKENLSNQNQNNDLHVNELIIKLQWNIWSNWTFTIW